MKRWLIVILLSVGAGFWLGRHSLAELRDTFFPATPRDAYVHRLEASGLGEAAVARQWLRAGERALVEAPLLDAPFREAGYVDPARPAAVAYRFRVRAGQRLDVDVRMEPPSGALVFVDLFRVPPPEAPDADDTDADDAAAAGSAPAEPPEPPEHVMSADSGETRLLIEPRRDAEYILRVQPELLRGGRYTLTVTPGPTLAFPVAGADAGDVRSFWGAARDGGARDHHGIDIFASRGTPVLAATDGRVSRVQTTPRGGRVVWLRDERFGKSLYYAHLERQLVRSGEWVRTGDTLGLVGNSGNARTTPPHLHFGIYRRGSGPVDPLPFVRPVDAPPADPAVDLADLGGWRRTAVEGARLRAAPDTRAAIVAELGRHAPIRVLGAIGEWYRVRAPDGRVGFMGGRITEPVGPLGTESLAADAALRTAPGDDGVEIARLAAGERVEVLGRAADQLWVRADGRAGWLRSGPGR